ncbi:hypothetical protein DUZ99_01575 [Xylanibacillus composti]|uniref:EfeO-type cupredoxin-like domain-containing protein n=1 Tax=Xylanibacillus composti TaxID=1572762 RepID=A0A8J4H4U6_9BACL|nr:cupredoxin domain-containing protein [Xylanibacillus composti]MDT9723688.1 hypothetical protein [Xylanibacillus composti]GIQ71027.1 hypothetical protein XYCOK13_38510 [Xylanibacillus composti]
MPKVWIINRRGLLFGLAVVLLVAAVILTSNSQADKVVPADAAPDQPRVIHMVTGEFEAEVAEDKEIEAYRWDPGTIVVNQGEHVKLSILGVNGKSHPFYIEGTSIKGEVKQGQETVIDLKFDKTGTYRLICLAHPDANHNGPMIAYIVVQ